MKLLFLTSTLPRFPDDMQAGFVIEQAKAWLAARPRHQIRILAPHDAGIPRSEMAGAIRIERFRYALRERWQRLAYPAILPNLRNSPRLYLQVPSFLVAEYRAAANLAREFRPDVVYAHWVMPQGLVAWRLKQKHNIPYVLQNHSSDLAVFLKAGKAGKRMARAVLRDATCFFCVNTAQRDFAIALFDGKERDEFAQRCRVLPMGIESATNAATVGGEQYEIATIARLSRKKGINYLIEAMENLARRGVKPKIGIAGDGEDRSLLESMVRDADIAFAGFLSGDQKNHFLARSNRFAFPARASEGDVEGLPVALLEALCRGRPVLASRDTNIEMLPEWPQIRDDVVFVRDPADITALEAAIEQLLQKLPNVAETTAKAMGRYRWDRLIEEYIVPIETALGKQQSPVG